MKNCQNEEPSPRFVLSSNDYDVLRYPRLCYTVPGKRALVGITDEAMVVRVTPKTPGGDWGGSSVPDLGMLNYLVLVARYPDLSIWDLESSDIWGRPVSAARISDWAVLDAETITPEMLGGFVWAEVYRSIEEVEEKVGRTGSVYSNYVE